MRLQIILNEALSTSQFKIEELGPKRFVVKANATSGPIIGVVRSIAYAEPSDDKELDYYDDDVSYGRWNKGVNKLPKSTKTSLLGRKLTNYMNFKSNGFIISGLSREELEQLIKLGVDYHNESNAEQEADKKAREAAKPAMNKARAEERKAINDERNATYGKKIVDRVKIRKHGGDDQYSWAVFLDGRMRLSGLSLSSAKHEQTREWKRLSDEMMSKNPVDDWSHKTS